MDGIAGRRAVVTGGARGIGAATCKALAEAGAEVILCDLDPAGEAAAGAIGAAFHRLDVTREAGWEALRDAYPAWDILVNNAGIAAAGPRAQDPGSVSLDDWRAVMAVNLDGAMLGCREALRAMAGGGAIVNVASRSAHVGVPGAPAYAASKAALLSLTRSVALHCAAHRLPIRCNAVSPGATRTPIWAPMLDAGADEAALVADVPLRRFAEAGEIARTVLFLASGAASYLTGAEIAADGGLSAGPLPPGG
ncbi:SDR family NAD(P)-dependent oxidoreductase [Jannaschia sp. W003]|uniref:SDR family NAD(P)-dependent oxidoreductase n=1 Tax=Jannaschia sp. W003 TaxID=2867012 RepID=UPI0021A83560|nr:SDR family oxidoreductase [Jannaschia sp. W003]UWQ20985.1 SDR family oxidoreductase [Jannaschia sp. W003]